jgi:DNA-binding IclR family transcriptional regulator
VLLALHEAGPSYVGEIVRLAATDPATCRRALERLASCGLVECGQLSCRPTPAGARAAALLMELARLIFSASPEPPGLLLGRF